MNPALFRTRPFIKGFVLFHSIFNNFSSHLQKGERSWTLCDIPCLPWKGEMRIFFAVLPGTLNTVPKPLAFPRKKKPCCNNSDTVMCSWNIWCQFWLILGKAGQEEELLKSWNLSQQQRRRRQGTGIFPPSAKAACQFEVHMLSRERCFAYHDDS